MAEPAKIPPNYLPPLAKLILASLVLKLAVWSVVVTQEPGRFIYQDSHTYHNTARSLVQLGRFSISPERPEEPETYRTPGYPLFLAPSYFVFQERPAAAIASQILLSLGTLALLFFLARERFGAATGYLAALLLALDLASFTHSLLLLTETLFTFLMLALIYGALRFTKGSRTWAWALEIGLCLGLATLVRPISYYLPPALVGWILVAAWRRRLSPRRTAAAVLAFAVPVIALMGTWQLRNLRLTGSSEISQIVGVDLLFYRGAQVIALRDGISLEEARHRLGKGWYRELHPETKDFSDQELTQRWKKEGTDILVHHPALVAQVMARGVVATLAGPGEHTLMRLLGIPIPSSGPLGDLYRLRANDYLRRWVVGRPLSFAAALVLVTFLAVLYLGGTIWWWRSLRRRQVQVFDLCAWGVLVYLLLASAGPESHHRYRVPFTPIFCLYAAAGWRRQRIPSPPQIGKKEGPKEGPAS